MVSPQSCPLVLNTSGGAPTLSSINRRPPRVGRNPRSGEQVTIPEKLVPHFKPGKALREAVDALPPADLPRAARTAEAKARAAEGAGRSGEPGARSGEPPAAGG